MSLTPTPEQSAIILAAADTTDNLLVSALAGAAKTSTLVMIAEALPETSILCLAFNKKIAVEMQQRLPSNCTAMTLNSLGHRVWSEATGRRLRVEGGKTGDLLMTYVKEELHGDGASFAYKNLGDLIKTIDFGKACGYIPTGTYEKAKRLFDDDFFLHIEQKVSPLEQDIIRDVTLRSLKAAMQGLCDYNDQILMPTVFHGAFPRYPLVLVDEAQDLSALNHATLRKLVGTRRLIAVGDSRQAIYGFRGAHEDSMAKLANDFSMTELTLSTTFRCPEAIVQHAQWRAPHMRAFRPGGEVRTLASWSSTDLPEGAFVLCRNNAPIFAMAIKLLKRGRYAQLVGNDIGKGLLRIMAKFGPSSMKKAELLQHIADWEETKSAKSRNAGSIRDRADCMRLFAEQGQTLSDAIAYAEHVFASDGPIKLMTGHKSKGLEFDNVFILDRDLLGKEGQDRNLRYVMQTRAKKTLTYINSGDLVDPV